ncbi:MAG: N-acetyltransferase [Bacteroidetes bacterium]|nr:MAG: N-acetyltransferase [Bacteroidota bacterium]
MSAFTVVNNEAQDRFETEVEGKLAVAEYMNRADKIVFTHTAVPEGLEGRGIGSALAQTALDWARAQGKVVLPLCPYIAAYIRRHPEHKDLVMEGYRL